MKLPGDQNHKKSRKRAHRKTVKAQACQTWVHVLIFVPQENYLFRNRNGRVLQIAKCTEFVETLKLVKGAAQSLPHAFQSCFRRFLTACLGTQLQKRLTSGGLGWNPPNTHSISRTVRFACCDAKLQVSEGVARLSRKCFFLQGSERASCKGWESVC